MDIWYHGSPSDFDEFKLNQKTNSRLGMGKSVYLTKEFKLAKAFAKRMGSTEIGFVYEVEIKKNHTGRLHYMQMLDDSMQPKDGYECVEITKVKELRIIKKLDVNPKL